MTSSPPSETTVTVADIHAAAGRIQLPPTPLLTAPDLGPGRISVKAENLQPTGSFKIRGATNFLARLCESTTPRGVVAYSSGNHAQAVAFAARARDIPATIFMPTDAPAMKLANTRAYGAEVILFDRVNDDRAALAHSHAEATGATVVPPFDHPWTIAGQGTTGLEIAGQTGGDVDAVLVNCGGGGLTAGIAIALAESCPNAAIYAVEPADYDDTAQSLAAGHPVTITPPRSTICDALMPVRPGDLTFAINRDRLAGVLLVTDDQVRAAMAYAFDRLKLVLEPGGAAALAAIHSGIAAQVFDLDGKHFDLDGKHVVAVASGGNVDARMFAAIIAG